jgi:hypothetical protein
MPNAAAASSLHSNCPCQNAAKKYGTVSLVVVTPPIPRGAGLRPSTSPAASRPTSEQNPFAPTSLPPCMVCDWKNTFTSAMRTRAHKTSIRGARPQLLDSNLRQRQPVRRRSHSVRCVRLSRPHRATVQPGLQASYPCSPTDGL